MPLMERAYAGEEAVELRQFIFLEMNDDTITVGELDDIAHTVEIAKPYLLQRTPFDGETRDGVTYTYTDGETRSATDGVTTEDQVIVPAYVINDIIVAARLTAENLKNQLYAEWLDINADGRAWAAVEE